MTAQELNQLIALVREGDAAELNLDATAIEKIKAGMSARAMLGTNMEPGAIYSTESSPKTVWVVGQDGIAVEVQPRAFVASPRNTSQFRPGTI